MAEAGEAPHSDDFEWPPPISVEREENRIHRLGAYVEKIVFDKVLMPHHTRVARKEANND